METYIYKTNIDNSSRVKQVVTLLKRYPTVSRCVVDTDDIDKVLKIESTAYLKEQELIESIRRAGYRCEEF